MKKMTKALTMLMCMVVLLVCMGGAALAAVTPPSDIKNREANKGFSSNWKYWMQGASSNANLRKYGCRVVAESKALAEMHLIDPAKMNPEEFFNLGVKKGYWNSGVTENGALGYGMIQYAKKELGYTIESEKITFSGSNMQTEADKIMEYLRAGKYVLLWDSDAGHAVYVLRKESLLAGEPIISDSFVGYSEHPYGYHEFIDFDGEWDDFSIDAYRYKTCRVFTLTPKASANKYVAVTNENGAPIRDDFFKTGDEIYTAPRGSWYEAVGHVLNSYDHVWYNVKLPNGKTGWIWEDNIAGCEPYVKQITNVNSKRYTPVHSDFYGASSTIIQAMQGDSVSILAETVNKHGNTWYLVEHSEGIGWIWAEYFSGNTNNPLLTGNNTYYVIDDPEAGTWIDGTGGATFDADGGSSLEIPAGYTSIDTITNAGNLKTITIPTSVTNISANAFSKCTALTTVNYKGTSAQWKSISIGSGNTNLTNAKIVYQGDAASTAAFSSVTATPTTTNAMLKATVQVTSGSGTFTGSGIRVYNSSGTVIASKDETHSYYRSASGTNSYNIWYDITDELGKTLTAGTSYSYQFYTVFNGQTIWSGKKSFTTTGTSMNFTYTLKEVTETSFTFAFKGTASTRGKFSEFGCKLIDLNTGETKMDYSNTTDSNLNVANAQYFSIDKWTLSGTSGHTYSMQLYYVFNGTRYNSAVYTIKFPDNTKPTITNVAVTETAANGYTVECTATDNNEIKNVQFATWTTLNGQDDLVYHNGTVDGTTWTCTINTGDGHNNATNCTYATQIIATDMHGNQATYTLNQYVDATPPVISNVVATPLYNGKYTVTCTVTDDQALDTVQAVSNFSSATKTTTTSGSTSGDTRTFTVNALSLNGTAGYYTTRINAYDESQNLATETVFIYIDAKAPVISDLRVNNITSYGFDVSCLITEDASEIEAVQFGAWTDACADESGDSKDDLIADWQTNAACAGTLGEDGRWTYHVSKADHNDETGLYHIDLWVKDGFGNTASGSTYGQIGAIAELLPDAKRASGTYGASEYIVYDQALTWTEAVAMCEEIGGELVMLTDEGENAFVTDLLNESDVTQSWIGAEGARAFSFGTATFRWLNGETVDFTNWASGQPGGTTTSYGVLLNEDSTWATQRKTQTCAFVCERPGKNLSGLSTMTLPEDVTQIQTEAFAGVGAEVIVLPEGCTKIGSRAFADSAALRYLIVPSISAIDIAEDAFEGSDVTLIEE